MPLPEALQGERWTEDIARKILPLLVWCAENEKTITYGQLDEELQRRGWGHHVNVVVYGHPAGAIGDAMIETEQETGVKHPPINALIVNAKSGIPGSGCDYYITNHLRGIPKRGLSDSDRQTMAWETFEEVWRFDGWRDVLKRYGLKPIVDAIPALEDVETSDREPTKSGWSSEPESEAHRKLKEWVADHPEVLASKIEFQRGETEWLFASGDRVDVLFQHGEGCIAVEVKSEISNDADLERGIYQCVKYRALLRAELKIKGLVPNGRSVLVTSKTVPAALQEDADNLGVSIIFVSKDSLKI
ncbi:hypothetical protein [Achromobacter sp. DH1f]|uniref:hypothetical protein n=1 Tax=Achromobacter sp. DH1f TaxID=1397275 RepID=UPI0012FF4BCB|nr:hypothetical protein [Achromobacter sp. DH1f]